MTIISTVGRAVKRILFRRSKESYKDEYLLNVYDALNYLSPLEIDKIQFLSNTPLSVLEELKKLDVCTYDEYLVWSTFKFKSDKL